MKIEKLRKKLEEAELNERTRRETQKIKERSERKERKTKERGRDSKVRSGTRTPDNEIIKEIHEKPVEPSWWQQAEKKRLKKDLIRHHVNEYSKPSRFCGQEYTPDARDIKDYTEILNKASYEELQKIGHFKHYPLKLDLLDRLKSIDKKKFAVVTIFNDNKTTDTGVCHCYSRTFSRRGMTYIVMSERGIYDPEFKMSHFYYYANNPFPIKFEKNHDPEAIADAQLMDDTIEMKVVEALANIEIDKTVKLILFISFIGAIVGAVNLLLTLKASGVIGG